ncbi:MULTISPECIES: Nramp family divalent metal transporter [Mycolicibacterium]|uniref:Divalent metal cation transporter n=1 Tax=Mycolicibacterium mucogenicum TaxID=56689 RepID=A0A1A0MUB3_MYCMU|nr:MULTISPECIES: Nramp family divalent metal transporter [Mycolicibacterium]OBA88997.1 divalent metal cation transporter [Mycolicibacterium mucogenicum]TDK90104.1 divalent metal cation transporter [Mycolicibacterium mucogenicum]GCA99878.1 divalent metal cation transporter MntH [Mycolicibacterium sp. NCC-Tsukiji]
MLTDTRAPSRSSRPTWSLLGPAFVAAIAYVDPGNVAANISAGAKFGFLLVWVILLANVMAGLVQYLSAKLGLTTGRSLPELVAENCRTPTRLAFWIQAEMVAVATDLAEVVGGAIALQLLFGLPMLVGGVITGVVSMCLLSVQNRGSQRAFERIIAGLLMIITIGFLTSLIVDPPAPGAVLGGVVPHFAGPESLLLATAILGATVMPHVVYLHSGLARDRHGKPETGAPLRHMLRVTRFDVGLAMVVAGAVNLSMLLVAATHLQGVEGTDTIAGAHAAVGHALGPAVALCFAVGLLASGLASSSVGAYAGAMIMQGLLNRSYPLLLRRAVTVIPALVVLAIGLDPTRALVISQVVLSFGIPFALIPLVRLTSNRAVMGENINHRIVTTLGWAVAVLISVLNVMLIYLTVRG